MLSKDILVQGLTPFMDAALLALPATKNAAAQQFATAYDTYARQAVDVSWDPVVTVNTAGFQNALSSGLIDPPGGTLASAAAAFDAAFVAYWTGAVFAVGVPPTPAAKCPSVGGTTLWSVEISSVVSTVLTGVLQAALLAEFAVLSSDAASKIDAIASAMHTATTTAVFVLITGLDTTPPPAGPLPITNTCTIL